MCALVEIFSITVHTNGTLRVTISVCRHAVLFYLLVFQIWMVSSSTLLCFSACSSRKSKKYLTAGGTTAPEHSTLRKKSSTNCCSVPWKGPQIMWDRAETESSTEINQDKAICTQCKGRFNTREYFLILKLAFQPKTLHRELDNYLNVPSRHVLRHKNTLLWIIIWV